MRQRTRISVALCIVGMLWCGFVVVMLLIAGAFGCSTDTSYCAETRAKNGVYAGVLESPGGRVLRNTEFAVRFESRSDEPPARGFTTDGRGRYCIVWANERIIPSVEIETDAGRPASGSLFLRANWRPLRGANPPPGCQTSDADIPWTRADDGWGGPEYVITLLLPLLAGALLFLGLAPGRVGQAGRVGGTALTLVSTVLMYTL